ncbi:unnamed protein product, partial [Rotaria socialis]
MSTSTNDKNAQRAIDYMSGARYKGEYKNGKRHGFGKLTLSNGSFYEGRFVENEKHGFGIYKWSNGAIYEGEFAHDQPHGKGKLTSRSGDIYDGVWANGKRHGQGTTTWKDGNAYEGLYDQNEKHGFGKHTWKDKGSTYAGTWEHNTPHGRGRYQYGNDDVYEGAFKQGKRHGQGKLTYANGDIYEGEYAEDLKHGTGRFSWANGDSYYGQFSNGLPEGTGEYIWASKDAPETSTSPVEERISKSEKKHTRKISSRHSVHRKVNKPKFPSYVRIHDGTTKQLVYDVDVSANNSNITYFNQTVTFSIPDSFQWHTNTEYNIAIDEGVLYSDSLSNPTAEFHRISSSAKVSNDGDPSTNVSIATHLTSDSTQTNVLSDSDTSNPTTVTTTTKSSTTTGRALVQGEQSATRSAQLGMILVWYSVCGYLPKLTDIIHLSCTNRNLHHVLEQDFFWRYLIRIRYGPILLKRYCDEIFSNKNNCDHLYSSDRHFVEFEKQYSQLPPAIVRNGWNLIVTDAQNGNMKGFAAAKRSKFYLPKLSSQLKMAITENRFRELVFQEDKTILSKLIYYYLSQRKIRLSFAYETYVCFDITRVSDANRPTIIDDTTSSFGSIAILDSRWLAAIRGEFHSIIPGRYAIFCRIKLELLRYEQPSDEDQFTGEFTCIPEYGIMSSLEWDQ